MAKKKEVNKKAKKVLDTAFESDVNPLKDFDARQQVVDFISKTLQPEDDSLVYKISVEDLQKKQWRYKEHFTKVFDFEFTHLKEYYSLDRKLTHFLKDLSEFLMWETNLLVDDEDNPLNQTKIAEALEINVRTVQRNMKELEERKIIHKIQVWNEVFYIINPYVMFKGSNVNIAIPKLFDEIGYINSSMVDKKNNRSNRKKEQQKRITVG
jgi:hypothetical protein